MAVVWKTVKYLLELLDRLNKHTDFLNTSKDTNENEDTYGQKILLEK